MTHAFEILTATEQMENPPRVPTPEPPTIPSVVPERIREVFDGLQEVLPEQSMPMRLIEEHEEEGVIIPAHMRGLYRASTTDTKEKCIEDIEEKLEDLEWYKIRYHQCRHDVEGKGRNKPCDPWQIEKEKGEVPKEI